MAKTPIKVVIVDDHELIRQAFSFLLRDEINIEVVATGACGEDAINLASELEPDIIILDVQMPGFGGIEAARKILRSQGNSKVIMLSSFNQPPFPSRLLDIGVQGYLHKGTNKANLVQAIETVYDDGVFLDPKIARELTLNNFGHENISPFSTLTERELQVFLMLVHGVSVDKISNYLCLSAKTVCGYRYALFDKLHIHTDVELTHLAFTHQIIQESVVQ